MKPLILLVITQMMAVAMFKKIKKMECSFQFFFGSSAL